MKKPLLLVYLIGLFYLSACQPIVTKTSYVEKDTPLKETAEPTSKSSLTPPPSPIPTHEPTNHPTLTPTAIPLGDRHVTLMAVGDIMLGRTIGDLIESDGSDAPFIFTAETLSSADITLGNLECSISNRGIAEEKTYTFRAPIAAGESLAGAGIDLVNLANNHVLDYGPLALEDTINILASNQIQSVGAGLNATEAYAPIYIEIDGLRLAFLAFADIPSTDYDYHTWKADANKPGIAWADEDEIRKGVQDAKQQADVVIVLVHNGYEIKQQVVKTQQNIAHLAIDSGASLVIGSHPHVLQRIDEYQEGLIVYSMGNFVFDNFLFPPNYSAILKVELSPNGVESYELIDVIIQLNGVPQIMEYDLD
ncbi:MAG: CapA family protein [Chloroflexota bacterium]|nr:CapA family protein [Chloroflexota bacterium]